MQRYFLFSVAGLFNTVAACQGQGQITLGLTLTGIPLINDPAEPELRMMGIVVLDVSDVTGGDIGIELRRDVMRARHTSCRPS